ncbi:MAG: hypothetical protein WC560_11060 [Syntrophales bacterium]
MIKERMIDPAAIDMPRLEPTERFYLANRLAGLTWGGYHKVLEEEFGEEKAIEITKKVGTWVFWEKLLPDVAKLLGVSEEQEPDLITFGKFIAFIEEQIMGCTVAGMEMTAERCVRNHSYCPWGEAFPGTGVCRAFIEFMDDLVKPMGFHCYHNALYGETGICRYTTEKIK